METPANETLDPIHGFLGCSPPPVSEGVMVVYDTATLDSREAPSHSWTETSRETAHTPFAVELSGSSQRVDLANSAIKKCLDKAASLVAVEQGITKLNQDWQDRPVRQDIPPPSLRGRIKKSWVSAEIALCFWFCVCGAHTDLFRKHVGFHANWGNSELTTIVLCAISFPIS